ncbi:MAG: hypothetical protein GX592_02200 [Clostridiales bacterium]|nr:hypothetical protein [Clostridiales bacterium]
MAIRTVRGLISPDSLGVTLMHEHVFMDLRNICAHATPAQREEPVTSENVGALRKNHRLLSDNLLLADEACAQSEIAEFKRLGGGAIVSMSNRGMGGNALAMRRISEALDVNLVECTGFYTRATHPEWMRDWSEARMAELFTRDLCEGIDDTGVRAGIIGEIGTGADIADREWRVLLAACISQRETGAAISVHIDPWTPNGMKVLRFLEKHGADLARIVIGHVDAVLDPGYCRDLLGAGCVIELDNFAKTYETPGLHFDTDARRLEVVARLVCEGYADQIVLSTDICLKTDLRRYGGGGYGHILRSILPALREMGVSEDAIFRMTERTPCRLLDF